jgi:uncharacterized protein (DUF2235 family)
MKKRLIICCDGTWNHPEDPSPTNVVRTARAIKPKGTDKTTGKRIPQIVFYDWGVGTGNLGEKLAGGALGKGLEKNVQDAYRFIVHNYVKGDQLFVYGFSRGAFTARSLGGMIRNCGILTRNKAHLIPDGFKMYKSKVHPDDKKAKRFRAAHAHHNELQDESPEVFFMGVWDTVGALGIPLRFLRRLNRKKHDFHDKKLSGIIKFGYHAMAIDEKRGDFEPVPWTTAPKPGQTVEQIWFPGVHTDVGGGYDESGLGNGGLRWMMTKSRDAGLGLDWTYLNSFQPNPLGKLHKSRKGMYKLKTKMVRTIFAYNKVPAGKALHTSVKKRYKEMKPKYRPENLVEFLKDNGVSW